MTRIRTFAVFALGVALVGTATACTPPAGTPTLPASPTSTRRPEDVSPPCSGGHYLEPRSLAELVHHADTIVEGWIAAIGTPMWYAPTPTAGPTPSFDAFRPYGLQPVSYHMVWYEVTASTVYRGEPSMGPGGRITVVVGICGESPCDPQIGSVGDRYLFFLARHGDGPYGVAYGPAGRLLPDAVPIQYGRPHWCPVPFAAGMSGEAFRRALREEVEREGKATITTMAATEG